MSSIVITASQFAVAYRRFIRAVEAHPDSDGPFVDFQSGLAADWERYKAWLYREAQRLLAAETWKKSWIGTGRILDHVIAAIEIRHDQKHRNNIVEWESKGRGEGQVSHSKLLEARNFKPLRERAEALLFQLYVKGEDGEATFKALKEQFGGRYDVISYLFFLRDWNRFMPLRSTIFPDAFELLGVPHPMSHRCNWENYQGFLARLREVQQHLSELGIPGGVRLVDAHSFCWMLAKLPIPSQRKEPLVEIFSLVPEAGRASSHRAPPSAGASFSQDDLDALQAAQRRLGSEAQRLVLSAEKQRLRKAGRADLAASVNDVSHYTRLGYDIESRFIDGSIKRIEVKAAALRDDALRFFLSENEHRQSILLEGYVFALVTCIGTARPRIDEFSGGELPPTSLHAVNYEVRLRKPKHK